MLASWIGILRCDWLAGGIPGLQRVQQKSVDLCELIESIFIYRYREPGEPRPRRPGFTARFQTDNLGADGTNRKETYKHTIMT